MAELSRLPVPATEVWDWQMNAACRDLDSAVFFHPAHERGPAAAARDAAAKRICAGCPVIADCARHALSVQEAYGVWGGLTPAERQIILRDRTRVPRAGAAPAPASAPPVRRDLPPDDGPA